jgi:calcium-dependent protein kinase
VYLHERKISHRDIKPENILFKEKEPKLADFGLARVLGETSTYTIVGTPYYLAPEVIAGEYNLKCDVWSLGVVLYFAITGKKPFVGEGCDDLFEKIQRDEIDFQGVAEEAQDFFRYVLKKDHKLRPCARDVLEHQWLRDG